MITLRDLNKLIQQLTARIEELEKANAETAQQKEKTNGEKRPYQRRIVSEDRAG